MGAVASNQQRALTVCQVGKPLLPPSLQSIWTHLPMLAGWLFDAEECTFGRWQDAGGERIVRDVCLIEQKLTGRWCGGLEAIMGGSFFIGNLDVMLEQDLSYATNATWFTVMMMMLLACAAHFSVSTMLR